MKHIDHFFETARERYRVRCKKRNGEPFPWTEDTILKTWSFCNVHREDDRTTIWFRENVRSKRLTHLQMVEACLIFRWFNRIETGEAVIDLLLEGWHSETARERLDDVQPIFTGAYIIRSPFGESKLDGILAAIDRSREMLPDMMPSFTSLFSAWQALKQLPYMGSFTSYEVVTDLRWTPVLESAPDIMTWAAAGPGCARGLSRVLNGSVNHFNYNSARDQIAMNAMMQVILKMSQQGDYWPNFWRPWEMREVEHWACEYDKYCRAQEGWNLKRRYKVRP